MSAHRSLTLRLSDNSLQKANLLSLVRLANFLGINTDRKDDETDNAYRHRLRKAIQRWESWAVAGRIGLYKDL